MRRFSTEPLPPLSQKHQTFCRAYVLGGIGYKAAVAAGYSARSSRLQAHRLLRREDVRAYLEKLKAEIRSQEPGNACNGEVTREWIIERHRAIASADPADYFTVDGAGALRWKSPAELTEAQKSAIAEIKTVPLGPTADGRIKIVGYRLLSRREAIKALERMQGVQAETVIEDGECAAFAFEVPSAATSEKSARPQAKHGVAQQK